MARAGYQLIYTVIICKCIVADVEAVLRCKWKMDYFCRDIAI